MSSTGAGYDYSCGTYSPDGRIFQVEYAVKAVESSGTAVGLKCSDGIVIVVEKPLISKMLVHGSNRRVFGIDAHAGVAVTGYVADGRQLVNRGRDEAKSYQEVYGHKITPSILANRIALFTHYFTMHSSLRPFGSVALLAAYDEDIATPQLYMLEPSGLCFSYYGCAAGKGANAAKTEVEKLLQKNNGAITCREAVTELAKIIYTVSDPTKDKPFELDMGWISADTNWKFQTVPKDLIDAADAAGKAAQVQDGGLAAFGVPEEKMEI